MSDFQEHLAEAMESEAFSKEYVNELTDLLANQRKIIDKYKRQLKDCVNELCYRCGDYKEEHLGRCNGCKWRVIRNGDA